MRAPSATSSAGGGGNDATSSKKPESSMLSNVESISYIRGTQSCHLLDLRDIFGFHLSSTNDPDAPSGERFRRVLLDSAVRAALRAGATARARVTPRSAHRTRHRPYPPGVAGRAARPALGRDAGDDGEPGDRALSRAQAVRARPGALRRAVLAARHGARQREPRGRAGGAGAGVRGHRWPGRIV